MKLLELSAPKYYVRLNRDQKPVEVESAIEAKFGELLFSALENYSGIRIYAQFPLLRFRYDFAVALRGRKWPRILIECDGHDYHSTWAQIQNDNRKNRCVKDHGMEIMRFRGVDIHHRPSLCIDCVLTKIQALIGPT